MNNFIGMRIMGEYTVDYVERDGKQMVITLSKPSPTTLNKELDFDEQDESKVKELFENAGKWEAYQKLHAELHSTD